MISFCSIASAKDSVSAYAPDFKYNILVESREIWLKQEYNFDYGYKPIGERMRVQALIGKPYQATRIQ
jgi:hypothetical protein